ncbi:MAG: zinc-ribbon domain-containing protein [Myxococcales bacterium]|nr:zinc-ribbon domain-containing protein [Myxococcales bacterium]
MKITCQSCGAKYAIADEKVRGRRVKVRCKGCNEPIIVDGYSEQQPEAAADEPAQAAGSPEAWSVNLSDTDQRSMTTEEIVQAWNAGQMPADAFVWKEGMGDWVPLASAPELSVYLSAPAHSAPVQPEPAPQFAFAAPAGGAARVERGRGAADIFGAAAAAGSEEEVVSSAAQPGEGEYDDQKPTGARNENSVLFSLDALKAGVGPAAPKAAPVARRGSVAPAPSDEKADLDDIMNMGGGGMAGPLFGMNANQALLAAPPPPPDPPPRPSIPSEMPAAFGSMPPPGYGQKKSNTLVLAVGGGVAFLAVIAIVIGVLALRSGKGEEAKAERPDKSGENSGKSGSTSPTTEKTETKPGEETKPEETKPADTSAAAPSASGEKKEVSEEDKKRFAEAMKKKEEEDKTKPPEEKKEEVAKKADPSSGVASFNKGAAIAALGGAAAQASGCKRPGGPTGGGRAVVTFASSGRVTSANISGGEFPGTSVGSCIAGVFRRAQVPAFSGDPVTVSKGFSISP